MKRWTNRLDTFSLISGLLVGLLVGMVLVGSSTGLREAMFGSATDSGGSSADGDVKDYSYYLVDLPSVQSWLASQYPDKGEELKKAVGSLSGLPSSINFRQEFVAAQNDIELVLPQVYTALTGSEKANDTKDTKQIDPTTSIQTCLGLDDDPYGMESKIYLYVTVPKVQEKTASIPEDWKKLDKPKSNVLYWQLLACYPQPDTQKPS